MYLPCRPSADDEQVDFGGGGRRHVVQYRIIRTRACCRCVMFIMDALRCSGDLEGGYRPISLVTSGGSCDEARGVPGCQLVSGGPQIKRAVFR